MASKIPKRALNAITPSSPRAPPSPAESPPVHPLSPPPNVAASNNAPPTAETPKASLFGRIPVRVDARKPSTPSPGNVKPRPESKIPFLQKVRTNDSPSNPVYEVIDTCPTPGEQPPRVIPKQREMPYQEETPNPITTSYQVAATPTYQLIPDKILDGAGLINDATTADSTPQKFHQDDNRVFHTCQAKRAPPVTSPIPDQANVNFEQDILVVIKPEDITYVERPLTRNDIAKAFKSSVEVLAEDVSNVDPPNPTLQFQDLHDHGLSKSQPASECSPAQFTVREDTVNIKAKSYPGVDPSEYVPTSTSPLGFMNHEMYQQKNSSQDVDVLFAPTPIRADSTISLSAETCPMKQQQQKSPTYLQMYLQKMEHEDQKTAKLAQKASREAELDYEAQAWRNEICTQTTPSLQNQQWFRAPELNVINKDISKESLLDDAKPPSITCGLTTEADEDSDDKMNENPTEVGTDPIVEFWDSESNSDHSEEEEMDGVEEEDGEQQVFDCEHKTRPPGSFGRTGTSGRKAKTIFSLELPFEENQLESSPGENGDGHGVVPRRADKINSVASVKKPVKVISHERSPVTQISSTSKVHVPQASKPPTEAMYGDWELETLMPNIGPNLGQDSIEILPSPSAPRMDEMKEIRRKSSTKVGVTSSMTSRTCVGRTCSAVLPKNSTLVLQREQSKFGLMFQTTFKIHNSTSYIYGFKICCNLAAQQNLTVSPEMGQIQPHSELYIEIKAISGKYGMRQLQSKDKIAIKLFRSFCGDLKNMAKFYDKLVEQQPELITTQYIENIIFWDSGDLVGMKKMLEAIKDEEELITVKSQVHQAQSQLEVSRTRSRRELGQMKNMMLIANENLANLTEQLNNIQTVTVLITTVFGALGFLCLARPFVTTDVVMVEEVVKPEETLVQGFFNYISAWNNYFWSLVTKN